MKINEVTLLVESWISSPQKTKPKQPVGSPFQILWPFFTASPSWPLGQFFPWLPPPSKKKTQEIPRSLPKNCVHPLDPSWLVVSTHLKNISQNGNLPQIGMKINIFETTTYLGIQTPAEVRCFQVGFGGPVIPSQEVIGSLRVSWWIQDSHRQTLCCLWGEDGS